MSVHSNSELFPGDQEVSRRQFTQTSVAGALFTALATSWLVVC